MTSLKTFATLEKAMTELKAYCLMAQYNPDKAKIEKAIYPARYDFAPINNIAKQIAKKLPLTDRQQILSVQLITKYRKQWKKQGYDVSNIDMDTPTEMPIREKVDRSKTVSFSGNVVQLRFPYVPKLIMQLATFRLNSCGHMSWNKETKVWDIAATAGNIVWLDKFVNDHSFSKDSSYNELIQQLNAAFDYKDIQLDMVDGRLLFHNAPESLTDWIRDNIGPLGFLNFVEIVSAAGTLAFTLSDSVVQYTVDNYPDIANIILLRRSLINPDTMQMGEMLKKVNQLQYNTVALFVTNQEDIMDYSIQVSKAMPEYVIISSARNCNTVRQPKDKTIYITHKVTNETPDLIISMAGFMAGPARRNWFNSAVKNIYYCHDVDEKIKKQLKKDESNINHKRRNER